MTGDAMCPICQSERFRFLYSSPAAKDPYARAAGLPPESSITSHFCLCCGVIFTVPRVLGEVAANVYSSNVPVHPSGANTYRRLFKHRPRWLRIASVRTAGDVAGTRRLC